MVVDAIDDQAAAFYRRSDFDELEIGACGGDWRTSRAHSESRPARLAQRSDDPGSPAQFRFCRRFGGSGPPGREG